MIQSFSDRDAEELFRTEINRRFAAIARVALRELIQMNQAGSLYDIKVPPANRLEALKGRFVGFHSTSGIRLRVHHPPSSAGLRRASRDTIDNFRPWRGY
jgi:toxin HigB-1